MPYNTTPIRPRKEVTGTVQLPRECSHPMCLSVPDEQQY